MRKINYFNTLLIVFGCIIIFDGIISIITQLRQTNEDLMYDLPRITRALLGSYMILFPLYYKDLSILSFKERVQFLFIGLILFFDGLLSIIIQIDETILFHFGRIIRIGIGIFCIFLVYLPRQVKTITINNNSNT